MISWPVAEQKVVWVFWSNLWYGHCSNSLSNSAWPWSSMFWKIVVVVLPGKVFVWHYRVTFCCRLLSVLNVWISLRTEYLHCRVVQSLTLNLPRTTYAMIYMWFQIRIARCSCRRYFDISILTIGRKSVRFRISHFRQAMTNIFLNCWVFYYHVPTSVALIKPNEKQNMTWRPTSK